MKELIFKNYPFEDNRLNYYIFSTFISTDCITSNNPGYSLINSYVYGLNEICKCKKEMIMTSEEIFYSVI